MSNIQKAVAELLNYPKTEIFKTFSQKTSESELITDWNVSNRKTYAIQNHVYDKNYDLMIEAQGLFKITWGKTRYARECFRRY